MKYLFVSLLAVATVSAVACKSGDKSYEVADSQTVTLAVSGMT